MFGNQNWSGGVPVLIYPGASKQINISNFLWLMFLYYDSTIAWKVLRNNACFNS